jgi:hypothetical protein
MYISIYISFIYYIDLVDRHPVQVYGWSCYIYGGWARYCWELNEAEADAVYSWSRSLNEVEADAVYSWRRSLNKAESDAVYSWSGSLNKVEADAVYGWSRSLNEVKADAVYSWSRSSISTSSKWRARKRIITNQGEKIGCRVSLPGVPHPSEYLCEVLLKLSRSKPATLPRGRLEPFSWWCFCESRWK